MNLTILEIFKSLVAKNKNVVISPYCIDILFGIVHTGTRGMIRSQFGKLINTNRDEYDLARIKAEIAELNQEESICEQFNEMHHSRAIAPVLDFVESIGKLVNLEVAILGNKERLDFLIRSKFKVAVKWKEAFRKVPFGLEPFLGASGVEIPAEYISISRIRGDNEIGYFSTDDFQAIQIPMCREDLFMEVYLPHRGSEYQTLVANLDKGIFLDLSNKFHAVKNLEVVLPKFELEFKAELKEELISLGFKDLFEPTFDFDPMLSSELPLEVLGIRHEAAFKLDEYGIAGSASTVLGGITGIPPKEETYILFEANRPFLYVLRNTSNNDVLFMGVLEEPQVNQLGVEKMQNNVLNRRIGLVRRFKPEIFSLTIRAKAYLALACLNRIVEHLGECEQVVKTWVGNVKAIISNEQEDLAIGLEKIYFGDGYDVTGYFDKNEYFELEAYQHFKSEHALICQAMAFVEQILDDAKILIDPDWYFSSPLRPTVELLELLVKHKIEIPNLDLFKIYPIAGEDILGDVILMDEKIINHLI